MTYLPPRRPAFQADRYGFQHAGASPAALDAFAHASEGMLAYRRDTATAIESALHAAPAMPAAHALHGFAMLLAGRAETQPLARLSLARAHPATSDEAALTHALEQGIAIGPRAAAAVLDAHLAERPHLPLLAKLAAMLHFLGGDAPAMRASIAAVLPAWDASRPGYSYLLGCHAFALEETGDFAAAEAAGRAAVAMQPDDPWAIHAVAHVLEMTGRAPEGIAWIEATRPGWTGCNNFAGHLWWHLALFHLERGDTARVLALYDRAIRAEPNEDNRDFANAAALLWRLRQTGVPVGDRWDELAAIAHRRRDETTHVFTALHRVLALVAAGDTAGAREAATALAGCTGDGEQARLATGIGAAMAQAILADAAALPSGDALALDLIAADLAPLGGSHAQRDVFMRTLLQLAARRGDTAALPRIAALRRRLKHDDAFMRDLHRQQTMM